MSRFAHTVCTACVLMLALEAGTATADKIYRSVGANGNVTFSSRPPANAVYVNEVSVQPGPSDAAQREAQERLQRQEMTANEMSEARERRLQEQQAETPAAPAPVERDEPINQYYGYPDPNSARRDQVRDRLQGRPVQLPARPMPR
jgi:Domain of unknown function (DUF4124)